MVAWLIHFVLLGSCLGQKFPVSRVPRPPRSPGAWVFSSAKVLLYWGHGLRLQEHVPSPLDRLHRIPESEEHPRNTDRKHHRGK